MRQSRRRLTSCEIHRRYPRHCTTVSNDDMYKQAASYSHRVKSPKYQGKGGNGSEELADVASLGHGVGTTVNSEVPDDDKVGNASNGVPTPLLRGTLATEGGEETSKDHDDIGNDSHEDVAAAKSSKKGEVDKEEGSGHGPIDVASPVD